MSLYRQNALIQAEQFTLLGEIFEYFELEHPLGDKRDEMLRKIGECTGMSDKYIEQAIRLRSSDP